MELNDSKLYTCFPHGYEHYFYIPVFQRLSTKHRACARLRFQRNLGIAILSSHDPYSYFSNRYLRNLISILSFICLAV